MVHGINLNKDKECELCLKYLKENEEEFLNNTLEDFDSINDSGEEYDY